MSILELLPSLKAACRPRFDSTIWPPDTHFHLGRLVIDTTVAEDLADCCGTPTMLGGVLLTRVRSVLAGIVTVDGQSSPMLAPGVLGAEIANRHSVASREYFAFGDRKIELPSDVRAGDVLALVPKS